MIRLLLATLATIGLACHLHANGIDETVLQSMARNKVPGVSVAVIRNGRLAWAKGYCVLKTGDVRAAVRTVDTNTLFQAASISKPVTAMAVLHMAQKGRFDLDEDINRLLRSWKLPENEFAARQKVAIRALLSHTAGITVEGFPGCPAGHPLPTLVQILNGEPPSNTAADTRRHRGR